ncbi:MAG: AtpZ/AtpI family protein [Candidatus Latescibacterota bacterium]|nr:AtpZ/AtpI family protein [Candidatus Latescibacterota bacterium]
MNDDIDPSRSKDETASASLRAVSPLLVAGIQFAATVLICIAGGWWLDQRFQTSPWLLLAGGLFGSVAAFYHFYQVVMRVSSPSQKSEDE